MQFQLIFILYYLEDYKGVGAIGAVVTATISDLVKEEQRSKSNGNNGNVHRYCICSINGRLGQDLIGASFGVHTFLYYNGYCTWFNFFLLKMVPNPPQITHTYNKKLRWVLFGKCKFN